jgi:hypothetical protein
MRRLHWSQRELTREHGTIGFRGTMPLASMELMRRASKLVDLSPRPIAAFERHAAAVPPLCLTAQSRTKCAVSRQRAGQALGPTGAQKHVFALQWAGRGVYRRRWASRSSVLVTCDTRHEKIGHKSAAAQRRAPAKEPSRIARMGCPKLDTLRALGAGREARLSFEQQLSRLPGATQALSKTHVISFKHPLIDSSLFFIPYQKHRILYSFWSVPRRHASMWPHSGSRSMTFGQEERAGGGGGAGHSAEDGVTFRAAEAGHTVDTAKGK